MLSVIKTFGVKLIQVAPIFKDVAISNNNKEMNKENNRHKESMAQHKEYMSQMENSQKNKEHRNNEKAKLNEQVRKDSHRKDDLIDQANAKEERLHGDKENLHNHLFGLQEKRLDDQSHHMQKILVGAKELNQAHLDTKNTHMYAITQMYQNIYARNSVVNSQIGCTIEEAIDNFEILREKEIIISREKANLVKLEAEYEKIKKNFIIYEHDTKTLRKELLEKYFEYKILNKKGFIDELDPKINDILHIAKKINNKKLNLIRINTEKRLKDDSISLLKNVIESTQHDKESARLNIRAALEAAKVVNLQAQQIDKSYTQNDQLLRFTDQPTLKDITPPHQTELLQ